MQLEELIISYKKGDNDALMHLLNRFNPIIKKYSRMLNSNANDNSEFVIFLINLFKNMPCNMKEESKIVKYTAKALKHEYLRLTALKCKKEKHEISLEELSSFEIFSCENMRNMDLRNAVLKLPHIQRQVIFLIFYKGKKESEIAKTLNITRQAVNKIKIRALKKMRKYLNEI